MMLLLFRVEVKKKFEKLSIRRQGVVTLSEQRWSLGTHEIFVSLIRNWSVTVN
jgi:hypothetical protein